MQALLSCAMRVGTSCLYPMRSRTSQHGHASANCRTSRTRQAQGLRLAFLLAIVSTSGRIHGELLKLLYGCQSTLKFTLRFTRPSFLFLCSVCSCVSLRNYGHFVVTHPICVGCTHTHTHTHTHLSRKNHQPRKPFERSVRNSKGPACLSASQCANNGCDHTDIQGKSWASTVHI